LRRFLARELAAQLGRPFVPFNRVAGFDATTASEIGRWTDTCAPSVAVALLLDRWSSRCG
jgi:hypothetical protein